MYILFCRLRTPIYTTYDMHRGFTIETDLEVREPTVVLFTLCPWSLICMIADFGQRFYLSSLTDVIDVGLGLGLGSETESEMSHEKPRKGQAVRGSRNPEPSRLLDIGVAFVANCPFSTYTCICGLQVQPWLCFPFILLLYRSCPSVCIMRQRADCPSRFAIFPPALS
jgi:hypothetical protein